MAENMPPFEDCVSGCNFDTPTSGIGVQVLSACAAGKARDQWNRDMEAGTEDQISWNTPRAGSWSQHRSVVFLWNRAQLGGPESSLAPGITQSSELDVGGTHMLLAIWLNLIFLALAALFLLTWLLTGRKNRTLLLIGLAFFLVGTLINLTKSFLE